MNTNNLKQHLTQPKPPSPGLPPELICTIYDILVANRDWDSLRACGTLSYSQLAPTRKRLFASVTLRLRTQPRAITIRDVVRRIQGLTEMLRRDPESRRYIQSFEILDSFPVYDSQWITQQASLPALLDFLPNLQVFTFGCEVGYILWDNFTTKLRVSLTKLLLAPQLKTLTLSNLGALPTSLFDSSVYHLYLKNITTYPDPSSTEDMQIDPSSTHPRRRLSYINIGTRSMTNTESAWSVVQACASTIKYIRWRCWEDPLARNGTSLPGPVNLSQLTSLRKLSFRISFGFAGRDLMGLCALLSTVAPKSNLRFLEIELLFPVQPTPHLNPEIPGHDAWKQLAIILVRPGYAALKFVTMQLTIHKKIKMIDGRRENSLVEFRKQMMPSLRGLSNASTFHFKLKVLAFTS